MASSCPRNCHIRRSSTQNCQQYCSALTARSRSQRGPPQSRGGTGRAASGRPGRHAHGALAEWQRRTRSHKVRQGHRGRARCGVARGKTAAQLEGFVTAERRRPPPCAGRRRRAGVEADDRSAERRSEHAWRPCGTLTVHHGRFTPKMRRSEKTNCWSSSPPALPMNDSQAASTPTVAVKH